MAGAGGMVVAAGCWRAAERELQAVWRSRVRRRHVAMRPARTAAALASRTTPTLPCSSPLQRLQPEALCAQRGLCRGRRRHPGRHAQDLHRVPGAVVHRRWVSLPPSLPLPPWGRGFVVCAGRRAAAPQGRSHRCPHHPLPPLPPPPPPSPPRRVLWLPALQGAGPPPQGLQPRGCRDLHPAGPRRGPPRRLHQQGAVGWVEVVGGRGCGWVGGW